MKKGDVCCFLVDHVTMKTASKSDHGSARSQRGLASLQTLGWLSRGRCSAAKCPEALIGPCTLHWDFRRRTRVALAKISQQNCEDVPNPAPSTCTSTFSYSRLERPLIHHGRRPRGCSLRAPVSRHPLLILSARHVSRAMPKRSRASCPSSPPRITTVKIPAYVALAPLERNILRPPPGPVVPQEADQGPEEGRQKGKAGP